MRRGKRFAVTCAIYPIILLCACSTQKDLVANATATFIWKNHEYKQSCVEKKGPPTCQETYLLLEELRSDTTVANEAQKIGKLPKSAVAKLKATMKALDK